MFKPRLAILLAFSLALALTACGPTAATPELPSGDAIATQIAVLLTSTTQATSPFTPLLTATPEPSLPTYTPESGLPSATATEALPSPTMPPTATPTQPPPPPTPTLAQEDPRLSLGEPTFQDTTFAKNRNWGSDWEDDYTRGEFEDNQLVLTSVGVDGWTVSWPRPEDFYIEMTATTGDCAGRDRYGLIVRVPETYDEGYLFGFTCDGQYSLRLWDPETEQYQVIVNWTESDYIRAGSDQTNRLGLMVEGNRFSLYANGHLLEKASDDRLEEKGRFGPWIGHASTDEFTIYITEIAYWDLSQ